MNNLARRPLHPLLFTLYPILALLANNISQVKANAAARPLLIALVGALLLWGLLRLLLRSWERSALVCTWLLILFFLYGHVYGYFEGDPGPAGWLGHHRVLLPLWLALAGLGTYLLARRVKDLAGVNFALNWIGLLLLVFPIVQLGSYAVRANAAESAKGEVPTEYLDQHLQAGETPPDVYYIILDAYTRQDVLSRTMNFDNSEFLNALKQRGFTIGVCSQSNYAQTEMSLTSSLNLAYLDDLGLDLKPGSQDRTVLRPLLRHSAVRQVLQNMGYTTVAFETGFLFSQFEDANVYLSPRVGTLGGLSGFEVMLVRTSGGLVLEDTSVVLPKLLRPDVDAPKKAQFARTRFALDELMRIPADIPGPKFVFAHIIAPHTPLVFNAQGELEIYPEEETAEATFFPAYVAEVTYLNQRMLEIVDAILTNSATPPVIIIQGDHGDDLASNEDRMAILNAYYLPGGGAGLYPSISPVNSFRVIFNRFFGGNFETLEDRSYFSLYQNPYSFREIPNFCQP